MPGALQYLHTIYHLRPVQVYGRVWFRLTRPRPDLRPAPSLRQRNSSDDWIWTPLYQNRLSRPFVFRFLNEEHELTSPADWSNRDWGRLWLYNLHYFNDLNSVESVKWRKHYGELIRRWISENPPARGVGWESYPLSLRIVNWIKWLLNGNAPQPNMVHSLAVQARFLRRRLEYHLLGNHLLANAKALIFAGCFFAGKEAQAWLEKGVSLIKQELREQILPDGGHYERSPMYHSTVLADILDLINVMRVYRDGLPSNWKDLPNQFQNTAQSMQGWLKNLCHPDGEIALLNDSAFASAPSRLALDAYARRLEVSNAPDPGHGLTPLRQSGYIRLQNDVAVALVDVGPIGPDHQPAHGHADTLSFELSLFRHRIVVDSGTSCYVASPERQHQRSTAAHNTVRIDKRDSSEIWGSFRVARRAHPNNVVTQVKGERLWVSACHDGYSHLRGKPRHCRQWDLERDSLRITDWIKGGGQHSVELFYHFHPSVSVEKTEPNKVRLALGNRQLAELEIDGVAEIAITDSTYHPEFGLSIANKKLVAAYVAPLPVSIRTRISWTNRTGL